MKKSLGANTIVFPTPVFLVGTHCENGQPNLMAAAWGGVCCSKPPCIAVSLRAATLSHGNIARTGAFTINVPSAKHVKEADYVGIVSGRDENKFETLGLTAVQSELVNAPYMDECPLVLECKLLHTFELGLHTQFVGEILDVKADGAILNEKDKPEIGKAQPLIYSAADRHYYGIGEDLGQAFSIGKK